MENAIKALRTSAKMSQEDLGRYLETGQSTISHWEMNTRHPQRKNFSLLLKLAKKFGQEAELVKYFCKL